MNEEGRALQDSQGQPRRVVLGDDGRTIFGEHTSQCFSLDEDALKHRSLNQGLFLFFLPEHPVGLQTWRAVPW